MSKDIQKNILTTFHYHSLLGKPLTLFECRSNYLALFKEKDFPDDLSLNFFRKILARMPEIEERRGFYFLKGQGSLVAKRLGLYNVSVEKWKRARKVAFLLACLPFVRMVAICNTVAFHTARRQSDIDFLIIVRAGRIWLTRFLVTFWVSLLGLRRHGHKIQDRICLSFYLADNSLNLKDVSLFDKAGYEIQDPYLIHWLARVCPLYDDGIGKRFFRANRWIEKELPFFINFLGVPRRRVICSRFCKLVKILQDVFLNSKLGDLLESSLKKIQISKMSRNTKSVAREANTKVVISDLMLKFHEKDTRADYRDALDRNLKFAKII